MTREDINDIIKTLCPNDKDFEKPIISPAYLKKELEALALEQKPKTITEFADRCQECGAKYGKALEQTRWIPVSERLPKYNTPVLLALKQIGKERTIVIGERRTRKSGWYFVDIAVYDTEHEVIAWMPLPEPYVPDINVGNRNCILDKIRAEIESCREGEEPHLCDYRYYRNEGLDMALNIIDKYKAEREVKYGRLDGRGTIKD